MKILAILGLVFATVTVSRGQECPSLKAAKPSELLTLLSTASPDSNNAECKHYAIMKLAENKSEDAIPLLVRYLEFRAPLTADENKGVSLHPPDNLRTYPAMWALLEYGSSVGPVMVAAIGSESTSELARRNAIEVLMQVQKYHEPYAISLLRKQEIAAANAATRQRFTEAIVIAEKWCTDKAACEQASQ